MQYMVLYYLLFCIKGVEFDTLKVNGLGEQMFLLVKRICGKIKKEQKFAAIINNVQFEAIERTMIYGKT